jgi:hypothetical protein
MSPETGRGGSFCRTYMLGGAGDQQRGDIGNHAEVAGLEGAELHVAIHIEYEPFAVGPNERDSFGQVELPIEARSR